MGAMSALTDHFGEVSDPRRAQGTRHKLLNIITIAICAVICGADNWVEVERYGRAKEDWFKTFLELPHGIPSHDTFEDVFARLKPEAFRAGFMSWVASITERITGEVIAIDGKVLRGSKDQVAGRSAIDLVSAWASQAGLILGQVKTDDHSNEITAIPELLDLLVIKDCIVTIDAIGCQTEIAEKIVAKEADYILQVKKNQGRLFEDLQELFAGCDEAAFVDVPHDYHRTINKDHGRLEIRQCWVLQDAAYLQYLRNQSAWANLQTVVRINRERRIGDKTTTETSFYLSSFGGTAAQHLDAVRRHWQIENCLHWVLDVAFREDQCRVRKGDGAENFSILRQMALLLLKQETTAKVGLKAKRLQAGWDDRYLLKVLQN